jgi:3-hydroxyisobutyrate dehydrogenase-like beta-hydroxyacid dehydrogenase
MLAAGAPDGELPNMRKDLHTALELARELGVALPIGAQVSQVADAGIATGHDDPAL